MRKTFNGSPGLWTAPNTEMISPGALKQASEALIRVNGLIEKSRPQRQYCLGAQSSITVMTPIAFYGNRFIGHGGDYVETGVGTQAFAATTPPFGLTRADSTDPNMRTVEVNGNLYLPTANGCVKWDSIASNPYRAGAPRALDVQLTLQAGTLLAATNQVAYRALFGIKDANTNLVLGPPGGRVAVTAAGAQDVSVKVWMPSAISGAANATSYFVQVYRTQISTVGGVDPGEEMQLVYQATLTAIDAGNKFITFVDGTPDNLRGAQGYFCPSQETLAQANYPPPVAQDTALFKGGTFYATTSQKHTARVQLLGVTKNLLTISVAAGGITKSGANGIYTFTGSPDLTSIPTDGTAKLSSTGNTSPANNGEFVINAVNTGAFTITVANAAAVTEAGAVTSRAWPSKITIAGVNYYGSINGTETAGSQIFKVSTSGTASQNVVDTSASLLRVVNQQATPVVYGYYESGPDDGAGRMLFEGVSYGGSSFTIASAGTLLSNSFNPTIPSAAAVASANDTAIHRLYFSKQNQPEHVPLGNYLDIGARSKKLLRIVALREALLVFKEDGLFRVTGDGTGAWAVAEFDTTAILLTKQVVTKMAGKAYAACVGGILEISESYVRQISANIIDKIRPFMDQHSIPGISTLTSQAWASEIDRTVGFFFSDSPGINVIGLLYSQTTGAWTALPYTELGVAGYYASNTISVAGVPYRAVGTDIFFDDRAYTRDAAITIAGTNRGPIPAHKVLLPFVSGLTGSVTYSNTFVGTYGTPAIGSIISGDPGLTEVDGQFSMVTGISIAGANTTLTLTPYGGSPHNATGNTYLWIPQTMTVEFTPYTSGDDAEGSRITEVGIMFDPSSTLTSCTLSMYTEVAASSQVLSMTVANTPLATGMVTQTLVRALVPRDMQHSRRLSVVFQHSAIGEFVVISGISYQFAPLDGAAHEVA